METSGAYSVICHDGWGNTSVGEFESLEEARQLFRTLCADRWFRTDGGIRRLSIVERAGGGTVDSYDVGTAGRG
ncbi:hypothetical protein CPCC7001_288 [Cyanobium sp. PCC 7001]|uniref:hypothetical protein n=1 Tax=Cyanobium sp. PCC 7001 TaxID=180281 RepID=UPI00018057BE|nr:hypothetical protein [Cyanobium sp. PCC 7001]EDY37410.1 hypothetical protein CPCC7001_288 [Cyanobium sp. PCC 7001]